MARKMPTRYSRQSGDRAEDTMVAVFNAKLRKRAAEQPGDGKAGPARRRGQPGSSWLCPPVGIRCGPRRAISIAVDRVAIDHHGGHLGQPSPIIATP